MELKIAQMQGKTNEVLLSEIMSLETTRTIHDVEGQRMGLLWNMSCESENLVNLDDYQGKLEHSSRCPGEHPVAIVSERRLEMVSFPIEKHIGLLVEKINASLHVKTNLIGHLIMDDKEVEVTAGFAGAKGNLIWFNTGSAALLLTLKAGEVTQSVVLEKGFGFCLGKGEKYTRVYISSVSKADDVFSEGDDAGGRSHAMFFGCDEGNQENWLGKLNAEVPAVEFKNREVLKGRRKTERLSDSDRKCRLGIVSENERRNQIRIAPMRGSNLSPNALSGRISEVEKWIRDTLRCVKSRNMPRTFSVTHRKEHPRDGEPFDVLWAKFEFDNIGWDDEVMWDIRYLLMGSKLDKLVGFPAELCDIREKLYITRDGISERGRGRRMD